MLLRTKKNRRKVDVKAAAVAHAPVALKLCVAAVLVTGLGFGAQVAYAWAKVSPHFAIKAIDVNGTARARDAELLEKSGLGAGVNLVSLDVAAVERSLSSHPWVKTA